MRTSNESEVGDPGALLPTIGKPFDLGELDTNALRALAAEIRRFLVSAVAQTGGHLGSNLGVVELTLALHRIFSSPTDTILWDTGHQAYVHKIVTGRQSGFVELRKHSGMSGYPSRDESPHDVIENSHASVALAYADGVAKARVLTGQAHRRVVVVVGDGALTGGVAWESLNNLGARPGDGVIIVLNDNGRSYAPTTGGFATHLANLRADRVAQAPATVFESVGLEYIGPVDGHDIAGLEAAFAAARDLGRSVVVHCVTEKGKGFAPAEADQRDHMHGPPPFDPSSGMALRPGSKTWTSVVGSTMCDLADADSEVVAITAAMLEPVGLGAFASRFPDRCFDVGIAEQHALASAAGLAIAGLHPVVCLYSTFLNRAFDQFLLDISLHRLPVTVVLDRAGVTGEDGPSHHGMWDLAALSVVPGARVAAPRDAAQLDALLREAVALQAPTVVRFPKGSPGMDLPAVRRMAELDVLREGTPGGVLLVSVGAVAPLCLQAAAQCERLGIDVTVVDPRWVLPVSPELVRLAANHSLVATVEDGCRNGGVGSALADALSDAGAHTPVLRLGLPRRFLHQGSRTQVLEDVGLTASAIAATLLRANGPAKPLNVLEQPAATA